LGSDQTGKADFPNPLPTPERKAAYVQVMFGRIARRYDLVNRLMTLGRDRAWRRYTVAQLGLHSVVSGYGLRPETGPAVGHGRPKIVLDLATGTGDLAFEVYRQYPAASVVGLDFVPQMLLLTQQKAATHSAGPALLAGDALRLPFADGAFDAVVTGFALRNVTDIATTFAEMARVTRPGGQVSCLEITRPRLPVFRRLFAFYFYRLVPLLGGWITGQRSAYTYLPHSLTAFPRPAEIADLMSRTGWRDVRYQTLMLGTVAVHTANRQEETARE
jgi:demethylmenaquinone methyltransferase/2-methoxy-6-polyprenyl-1,4-benzoquinol methylase